jgi:RNA polymerase sigma-70 factor, ECF subfamily
LLIKADRELNAVKSCLFGISMNKLTETIIENAAAGDMHAFGDVYKETAGFVFNVALRFTCSREDAEEVTQNIYVKLFKNLGQYQRGTSFKAWLYRVTCNEALNFIKKRASEKDKKEGFSRNEILKEAPEIEKRIDAEHARLIVAASLKLLTPEFRACIVLREINGFTYEQIAQTLGIKTNTVRTRLKRARMKLMAAAQQVKKGMSYEM